MSGYSHAEELLLSVCRAPAPRLAGIEGGDGTRHATARDGVLHTTSKIAASLARSELVRKALAFTVPAPIILLETYSRNGVYRLLYGRGVYTNTPYLRGSHIRTWNVVGRVTCLLWVSQLQCKSGWRIAPGSDGWNEA